MIQKHPVLLSTWLLCMPCFGGEVVIPAGTTFFGVITDPITSSPDEFHENQIINAQIYEPLIIQGETVIPAETTIRLRITELEKKKALGRGGHISLAVMSTTAVVTPWTLFMQGDNATIPAGAIFDVEIPAATRVQVADPGID